MHFSKDTEEMSSWSCYSQRELGLPDRQRELVFMGHVACYPQVFPVSLSGPHGRKSRVHGDTSCPSLPHTQPCPVTYYSRLQGNWGHKLTCPSAMSSPASGWGLSCLSLNSGCKAGGDDKTSMEANSTCYSNLLPSVTQCNLYRNPVRQVLLV